MGGVAPPPERLSAVAFHDSVFGYLCAFSPQGPGVFCILENLVCLLIFIRDYFLGHCYGQQFTWPLRSVTGIYEFVRPIFCSVSHASHMSVFLPRTKANYSSFFLSLSLSCSNTLFPVARLP